MMSDKNNLFPPTNLDLSKMLLTASLPQYPSFQEPQLSMNTFPQILPPMANGTLDHLRILLSTYPSLTVNSNTTPPLSGQIGQHIPQAVQNNQESFTISKLIDSSRETLADSAGSKLMSQLLQSLSQPQHQEFQHHQQQQQEQKPISLVMKSPDVEVSSENPGSVSNCDNESVNSSDSNQKVDVDWLRNLIKTAGAVIKPGKPTSFFQLRQRRDSAEITSLAKDLESRKKRFVCSFPNCNKAYYKRSHLKEHSYIHTGDKPYICSHSDCGARFTRADQLSRHRRAHTGERNFCCLVCSKRFKRSDHLKVHLARHAGQQFDNSLLPSLNSANISTINTDSTESNN